MERVSYQLLGQNGSQDIDSAAGKVEFTDPAKQPVALFAVNGVDAVITQLVDVRNVGDLVTTISAGTVLYGTFDTIHLTSGTLRCYFG